MNWKILLLAISMIESSGNPAAINKKENAIGLYQLRQIYIDDVNRMHNTSYTLDDAWNPVIAEEIVKLYISSWLDKRDLNYTYQNAARIHNGGPNGYKKDTTLYYWKKIKLELERLNAL